MDQSLRATKRYRKSLRIAFVLSGILFLFLVFLLLDTLVGVLRGWEIRSKAEWATITMITALASFTLAIFFGARRLSDTTVGRIARIETALVATVIALLLVEVVLRLTPAANVYDGFDQQMNHSSRPNMVRHDDGGTISRNSLGLRGPEMPSSPHTIRVLAVGGSTTESGAVDGSTWTDLAMKRINRELAKPHRVWIGNAGMAGFSTKHHSHFVRECPWLEQMDYAVFLVGINDAALYLLGKYDEPIQAFVAPRWRQCRLFRNLYFVWTRFRGSLQPNSIIGVANRVRNRRGAGIVAQSVPELQPGLIEYRRRIEEIISVCRNRNVEPVFMTQPTLYQEGTNPDVEELMWFGAVDPEKTTWLNMQQMRQVMLAFNSTLLDTCNSRKTACIDTRIMNGRVDYFVDDCHFTSMGEEAIADHVYRWFMAVLL